MRYFGIWCIRIPEFLGAYSARYQLHPCVGYVLTGDPRGAENEINLRRVM